jgi:hypothetical protein
MGVPPPSSAATGFGRYAGSMIQNAQINGIMRKSVLIV